MKNKFEYNSILKFIEIIINEKNILSFKNNI